MAYSVWLFKGEAYRKLDSHLTKSSGWVVDQLLRFYDEKTAEGLIGKVMAFRSMHIQGRALQLLLPQAVERLEDYEYMDGEIVAGMVLGWNFGDGHLHNEHLLRSLQRRCQWESGEVRVIFVDPQPIFRPHLDWQIWDAKDGQLEHGRTKVDDLIDRQPYPTEPIHV